MAIFDVPLARLRERGSIKWRRFDADVLPLFVAEMDADLAAPIAERLQRAIALGDTGYPEVPEYQAAMADFAGWMWGWDLDPAHAKLATDVMTGMREAVVAASEPGDAIVFNPPIYPPFRAISAGRRTVEVPLVDDRLDLARLEVAFAVERPSVYLLCSPHNPNGTIHTLEELTAVADLAARYGVTVIADEIHAPLAGAAHTPYLTIPGAANAYLVTSASKSWNLAALKAGLVIGAPADLARLSPTMSDGASYFGVLAHTAALREGRDWLAGAREEIAANKVFLAEEIARKLPQLSYTPSEGTYLAWLDCTPLGLADPGAHFHEVGRVRFNLGREFAPETTQFVRINTATSQAILGEAVDRMVRSLGA